MQQFRSVWHREVTEVLYRANITPTPTTTTTTTTSDGLGLMLAAVQHRILPHT